MSASAAPRVVLVGPPGAGKSTVGRALAQALDCGVSDSDALMEQDAGTTCGELFTTLGEPEFRRREEVFVRRALHTDGVVSLGGGAVLSASTRELLAGHTVIYLKISAEEGTRRTAHLSTRPVLTGADGEDPAARYREILAQRENLYREVATETVDADSRTPSQTVTEVLSILEQTSQPHGATHGTHDPERQV